jgi:hypothetical protein
MSPLLPYLFACDPTDKEPQRPITVCGHANLCVRLESSEAFDLIVIPVQNVVLVISHAIGDGFSVAVALH